MDILSTANLVGTVEANYDGPTEAQNLLNNMANSRYRELRKIASIERSKRIPFSDTYNTTTIVNETFARLTTSASLPTDERHLFNIYWTAVVCFIKDSLDLRNAKKRIPKHLFSDLDALGNDHVGPEAEFGLNEDTEILFKQLITKLSKIDERSAKIAYLYLFLEMPLAECGHVVGLKLSQTKRDWDFAKAFIGNEIRKIR